MRHVQARNAARGTVLGTRIGVADRWWLRLRGLLGRPELQTGEGLLIAPCRAVHMSGMSYAIDVAFVAPAGKVVAVYPELAPGKRTSWHREAHQALELPAGTLAATGTRAGDFILCTTEEAA